MNSYPDLPCEQTSLLLELASLPPKPPRSKLEPHCELIRELRRKGRTYREVARLFEERVGFHVAPSTLHSFVKVRARHRKQVQFELPPADVAREIAPTPNSRVAAFKAKPAVKEESVPASSSAKTNPSPSALKEVQNDEFQARGFHDGWQRRRRQDGCHGRFGRMVRSE